MFPCQIRILSKSSFAWLLHVWAVAYVDIMFSIMVLLVTLVFKGTISCIPCLCENLEISIFSDAVKARYKKICIVVTLMNAYVNACWIRVNCVPCVLLILSFIGVGSTHTLEKIHICTDSGVDLHISFSDCLVIVTVFRGSKFFTSVNVTVPKSMICR